MKNGSPKDSSVEQGGSGGQAAPRPRAPRQRWFARWLWIVLASMPVMLVIWVIVRPTSPSGPWGTRGPEAPASSRQDLAKLLADAGTRPTIDTRPAESALAPLRAKLVLPPRRSPSPHLVFAGDRVVWTVEAGIEVVELGETPAQTKRSTFRATGVRALFELGSSFGALVDKNVLLFESKKKGPTRLPGVTWLPRARVFPDLISRNHLLVLHPPNHAIYRYVMTAEEGPLLPLAAHHELRDFDQKVFVALRDGSFVYSSGESFNRLYASGHAKKLATPSADAAPFRGLRARRIDQIFVLYENGLVRKLHLLDRVRVAWSSRLAGVPFDLVASGDDLVSLEDAPGDKRTWRLRVVGPGRKEPFLIELGSSEDLGEDWVQRLHEGYGVAASKGRVAVVGPGGLSVWQLSTGERLLGPP